MGRFEKLQRKIFEKFFMKYSAEIRLQDMEKMREDFEIILVMNGLSLEQAIANAEKKLSERSAVIDKKSKIYHLALEQQNRMWKSLGRDYDVRKKVVGAISRFRR